MRKIDFGGFKAKFFRPRPPSEGQPPPVTRQRPSIFDRKRPTFGAPSSGFRGVLVTRAARRAQRAAARIDAIADPVMQAEMREYQHLSFVQKIPIIGMGLFNIQAAYALSLGLRFVVESYCPALAGALPWLFHADQANLDFFHWHDSASGPGILSTWAGANVFGVLVSFPLFTGLEAFKSRNPLQRQKIRNFLHLPQTPKEPTMDVLNSALQDGKKSVATLYGKEFFLRGVIGVIRLLGKHMPSAVPSLGRIKTRLLAVGGRPFNESTVAGSIANKVVRGCGLPRFAKFLGQVMPVGTGQFAGFSLGILANVGTDVVNAHIFNPNRALWALIYPSFIIGVLVEFANTKISQCHRLTYAGQFAHRTGVGIFRSMVYRGMCASATVTPGLNVFAQLVYGLGAMYYADRLHEGPPPPKDARQSVAAMGTA